MSQLKTIGTIVYYSGMAMLFVGFIVLVVSLGDIVSGLTSSIGGMYASAGQGAARAPPPAPSSGMSGAFEAIDYILWPAGIVIDNTLASIGVIPLGDEQMQSMFYPRIRRFFMIFITGFILLAIGALLRIAAGVADYWEGRGRKARLRDKLLIRSGHGGMGTSSSDEPGDYSSIGGGSGSGYVPRSEHEDSSGSSFSDNFLVYAVVGLILLMIIGAIPLFLLPPEEVKAQIESIQGQCGPGYEYSGGACVPVQNTSANSPAQEVVPSDPAAPPVAAPTAGDGAASSAPAIAAEGCALDLYLDSQIQNMLSSRRNADQSEVASQLKLDVAAVQAEWASGKNYSQYAPGYERNFASEIERMKQECAR